jgi:hypothetical protein
MMVIGFLIVVALIFLIIGQIKNAEIILSPIVGIMFGFLYHKEQFEEENEYTLQCVLCVISITVIWTNQQNGLEK